jgi:hypothetical protein
MAALHAQVIQGLRRFENLDMNRSERDENAIYLDRVHRRINQCWLPKASPRWETQPAETQPAAAPAASPPSVGP